MKNLTNLAKKMLRHKAKRIEKSLRKALLNEGEMAYSLYEYELVKHLDYWYQGLLRDNDELVFVVTENREDVAMVLILPDKTHYINEEAREKLKQYWSPAYEYNIKKLLPMMSDYLANDIFSVNGVQLIKE